MLTLFKRKKVYGVLLFLFSAYVLFYYTVIQSSLSFSKNIDNQVKHIIKENLKIHVKALSDIGSRLTMKNKELRYDNTKRNQKINYLSQQLKSYGYAITKEEFTIDFKNLKGAIGINLFATKKGEKQPYTIIEIGAHYDTRTDSPGADDNSSGISALLEIARNLQDIKHQKSIRLCFFDLEEFGLFGSREHVKRIKLNKEVTVEEIIVIEMIGFATDKENSQTTPIRIPLFVDPPTTGNFISFVSNWQSRELAYQFEDAAGLYGNIPSFGLKTIGGFLKDADRSDHYPYWLENYKAIMITDTANFRNKHYHQTTDTPDTLNYKFMHNVTMAIYALLLHRANHIPE